MIFPTHGVSDESTQGKRFSRLQGAIVFALGGREPAQVPFAFLEKSRWCGREELEGQKQSN